MTSAHLGELDITIVGEVCRNPAYVGDLVDSMLLGICF